MKEVVAGLLGAAITVYLGSSLSAIMHLACLMVVWPIGRFLDFVAFLLGFDGVGIEFKCALLAVHLGRLLSVAACIYLAISGFESRDVFSALLSIGFAAGTAYGLGAWDALCDWYSKRKTRHTEEGQLPETSFTLTGYSRRKRLRAAEKRTKEGWVETDLADLKRAVLVIVGFGLLFYFANLRDQIREATSVTAKQRNRIAELEERVRHLEAQNGKLDAEKSGILKHNKKIEEVRAKSSRVRYNEPR